MKLFMSFALLIAIAVPAIAQDEAKNFGTRAPMTCDSVTSKSLPTIDQIKKLVQCNSEKDFGGTIYLMEDLKVQVGGATRWNAADALLTTDADTHHAVYPIRGSFTEVSCRKQFAWSSFRGRNCSVQPILEDHGICWKTTFGDWKCGFGGRDLRSGPKQTDVPPPPAAQATK